MAVIRVAKRTKPNGAATGVLDAPMVVPARLVTAVPEMVARPKPPARRPRRERLLQVVGLPDMADEALAALVMQDNEDAWNVLYGRYYDWATKVVGAYAKSHGHGRADVEDVAQDAMLKAWMNRNRYRPGAPYRAWLSGIVKNTARAHYRAERRRMARMDEAALLEPASRSSRHASRAERRDSPAAPGAGLWVASEPTAPDRAAERSETETLVQAALARLNPADRDLLLAWAEDGREAERAPGENLSTRRTRVRRAQAKLRVVLEELGSAVLPETGSDTGEVAESIEQEMDVPEIAAEAEVDEVPVSSVSTVSVAATEPEAPGTVVELVAEEAPVAVPAPKAMVDLVAELQYDLFGLSTPAMRRRSRQRA